MTLPELREKAEQLAPAGCAMSAAVLELLADRDRRIAEAVRLIDWAHALRRRVGELQAAEGALREDLALAHALIDRLGERCLTQSGIITRMVERKYPEVLAQHTPGRPV